MEAALRSESPDMLQQWTAAGWRGRGADCGLQNEETETCGGGTEYGRPPVVFLRRRRSSGVWGRPAGRPGESRIPPRAWSRRAERSREHRASGRLAFLAAGFFLCLLMRQAINTWPNRPGTTRATRKRGLLLKFPSIWCWAELELEKGLTHLFFFGLQ
jgi:hypothetical protein